MQKKDYLKKLKDNKKNCHTIVLGYEESFYLNSGNKIIFSDFLAILNDGCEIKITHSSSFSNCLSNLEFNLLNEFEVFWFSPKKEPTEILLICDEVEIDTFSCNQVSLDIIGTSEVDGEKCVLLFHYFPEVYNKVTVFLAGDPDVSEFLITNIVRLCSFQATPKKLNEIQLL
ncbi:hypothetical protein [Aminipila sp.]|uniref:hypothetical protein n=1 Tax=Aminipila sp. TaxID=2060095 RepID=UPI00289F6E4D|nr:hypothetical protein [Aminipila sp.]